MARVPQSLPPGFGSAEIYAASFISTVMELTELNQTDGDFKVSAAGN
jgi:hypothetical protein